MEEVVRARQDVTDLPGEGGCCRGVSRQPPPPPGIGLPPPPRGGRGHTLISSLVLA